jgi:hypothetical protein
MDLDIAGSVLACGFTAAVSAVKNMGTSDAPKTVVSFANPRVPRGGEAS